MESPWTWPNQRQVWPAPESEPSVVSGRKSEFASRPPASKLRRHDALQSHELDSLRTTGKARGLGAGGEDAGRP